MILMERIGIVLLLTLIFSVTGVPVYGQSDTLRTKDSSQKQGKDTLSKFDSFNKKAEKLFKVLPVPIYGYNNEAGNIFGLAKFNVFSLSKKDTISKPSKISGVATFSSKGQINVSVASDLIFHQNDYIVTAYVNFKQQPEYIFGIGNNVTKAGAESISSTRIAFAVNASKQFFKNFYAGIAIQVASYFDIQTDSNSFLIEDSVPGVAGGPSVGVGITASYDTRDNRYNASKGEYVIANMLFASSFLGSAYQYKKFELDARKYFNPWGTDVIACQATTTACAGTTPFYSLALMGGDYQMRGYYEGAFRDNILIDGQVEYRKHVWNIFGVVGWFGIGQVQPFYKYFGLNEFHLNYGGGLRIRVDSKHNTNLRFDFGFGPGGIQGGIINFAEAF